MSEDIAGTNLVQCQHCNKFYDYKFSELHMCEGKIKAFRQLTGSDEDDELGLLMSKQINLLAATFYQSDGRVFSPTIDFKNSTHPEERACWNKAIIAHAFINKDAGLLKFQV